MPIDGLLGRAVLYKGVIMAALKQIRSFCGDMSSDIQGSLDSVIEALSEARRQGELHGFTHLEIEVRTTEDYGCWSTDVLLYGRRLETDEEARAREVEENNRHAKSEAIERMQFERLKAKFG